MLVKIKDLFYTDTGRDTLIVFTGTFANVIVGGIFFILAPRLLGPSHYGLFSTVVATTLLATAIANFGLDTAILRFAKKNSKQINTILSLALKYYVILGFSTSLIGFFIAPYLAFFLGKQELGELFRIGFLGIFFMLLSNFFVAGLQAKREFLKASIVNLSANLTRLLVVLIAFNSFFHGLYFLTAIFFFAPFISVIVGKLYLPFQIKIPQKEISQDFVKYNFWVASALIISSIPFDNYLLLKIAGPDQTGLYSAPFKLLTFAYQFGGNFTRVLASRFASFDTNQKTKEFILKTIPFPLVFAVGLITIFAIAKPLTILLFGEEFIGAVNLLRILSVGFIFFIFSTIPSSLILYYFGKSNISFVITFARYVLFVILLGLLIPQFQAQGAAFAFSLSEIFAFILMSSYVIYKLKKP